MSAPESANSLVKYPQLNLNQLPMVARGLLAVHGTDKNTAADKHYQEGLRLCGELDLEALADINGHVTFNEVDLTSAKAAFTQAAELNHREAKFCIGALLAHSDPLLAIRWYEKAADQGHAVAAFQFVKYLYLDDKSLRSDFAKPIYEERVCELLQIAADEKHIAALRELAHIFRKQAQQPECKIGVSLYMRASDLYRQAAEQGDVESAFQLAEILTTGEGAGKNLDEAVKWYQFCVDNQDWRAMIELAYLFEIKPELDQKVDRAARLYFLGGKLALELEHTDKGVEALVCAATLKQLEAARLLAEFYDSTDKDKAYEWYKKAAELGDLNAQIFIGKQYQKDQKLSLALEWLTKAAEQGDVESAYQIALWHCNGVKEIKVNETEAARWFIFAAENRCKDAYFYAGWVFDTGFGVECDYKKAVGYYKKGVQNKDKSAINNLGFMYEHGRGVAEDASKAFEHYKTAASLGNAVAKTNLASCFKAGRGTEKNIEDAIYWMKEAAEIDCNARAQYLWGQWHANGEILNENLELSLTWYERAAKQDYLLAVSQCGYMYFNGIGIEKNVELGINFWRRAGEAGHEIAQYNMGLVNEKGLGVEKNQSEAIRWYRLAARQMHQFAIDALNRLGVSVHGSVLPSDIRAIKQEIQDRVHKALTKALASDDKVLIK